MLISADKFNSMPVMSLQTGSELARTARTIINPYSLSIVAYELSGALLTQHPALLRVADIREIGPMGMIIDSADELIEPGDVVKIQEIYDIGFSLDNIKVVNERKTTIGRVIGYTMEAESFVIQQLRVKRPFLKSLGDVELLIHRSQIVEISLDKIIVKSPEVRHAQPINLPSQTLDNPFRSRPRTEPETSDT